MHFAQIVEKIYQEHTKIFLNCEAFQKLESGEGSRADYDQFICNVFRTHQNSPQYLAFLLSVSPPSAIERIQHNLLEELGLEEGEEESHPDLLLALIEGAGLGEHIETLKAAAQASMRETVCEPLLYGSLREIGFAAMLEVFSFEHMLAHSSTRIANMLANHRGLSEESLVWFRHHSEVDIQHAQEALLTIQETCEYYEFDEDEAQDIIDMSLRENVFIKRYFDTFALAQTQSFL